jgi:hypothetical protein
MFPKEFINYQDKLYWIYRKVRQSQIIENKVSDLKDFWMCDIVIKNRQNDDNTLFFLREITDVVILNN